MGNSTDNVEKHPHWVHDEGCSSVDYEIGTLRAELEWIANRCRRVMLSGGAVNYANHIHDIQMAAEAALKRTTE